MGSAWNHERVIRQPYAERGWVVTPFTPRSKFAGVWVYRITGPNIMTRESGAVASFPHGYDEAAMCWLRFGHLRGAIHSSASSAHTSFQCYISNHFKVPGSIKATHAHGQGGI